TLSETVDLECKLAAGKDGRGQLPTDFWKTYSAFANTHGGIILLGLREKNGKFSVNGVDEPEKVITNLFNIINNPQKVSLNLLTDQNVTSFDLGGKTVIRVEVPLGRMAVEKKIMTGKMTGKMTRKILDLLTSSPTLTIPEIAASLKKSESTVERAIRELRKLDKLRRVGSRKSGYWEIVDDH
ncbi:MAG: putative DNA binding domain-containing protein, partial [Desulfobulbaceae bacterium]|nr:putative DNA binding domain-containing protein [Desulfobulbaceae bacterium]